MDSSSYGLGAVLEQDNKPVIFISRRLNQAESHYRQTQKEALAIIWALKRLHNYLYAKKFDIITDHKALTFIFNPTKPINGQTTSMLTRWSCLLAQYNYNIVHKKGSQIPTADYLSRYAFQEEPKPATVKFLQAIPVDRNRLIQESQSF